MNDAIPGEEECFHGRPRCSSVPRDRVPSHNRSQPGHESDSSWKCTVVLCLHCNIYIYKKTCREIIGDMSVGREAGRHQAWKSDILKTVSTHIGFN